MKKVLAEGKFTNFVDRDGWEYIERKNNTPVVSIIAYSGQKIIFVRQHRKPVDKYVIEFPAGIVDPGENVEDAALRELKEETGYEGVIKTVMEPTAKSPGITDETTQMIFVDCKSKGKQNLQDEEDIQVIEVDTSNNESIAKFTAEVVTRGDMFSTTVALFLSLVVSGNGLKQYYEEVLKHEKD